MYVQVLFSPEPGTEHPSLDFIGQLNTPKDSRVAFVKQLVDIGETSGWWSLASFYLL